MGLRGGSGSQGMTSGVLGHPEKHEFTLQPGCKGRVAQGTRHGGLRPLSHRGRSSVAKATANSSTHRGLGQEGQIVGAGHDYGAEAVPSTASLEPQYPPPVQQGTPRHLCPGVIVMGLTECTLLILLLGLWVSTSMCLVRGPLRTVLSSGLVIHTTTYFQPQGRPQ